jgi:hypothetical protein
MVDVNLLGTIVLDLEKAFDTVDHFMVCRRPHYYKISRKPVAWFKSYLSPRTQKIVILAIFKLDGKTPCKMLRFIK